MPRWTQQSSSPIEGEEWRPVIGSANYEISNFGRCRRTTNTKHFKIGYMLRPRPNQKGYLRYQLDGHSHYVQRLVLLAFVGPPPSGDHEAAHNDGDKTHNTLDNLSWKTQDANNEDKRKHGRLKGGKNSQATLTEAIVQFVIKQYALGYRNADIVEQVERIFKLSLKQETVRDAAIGSSWKHVESPWRELARRMARFNRNRHRLEESVAKYRLVFE